MPTTSEIDLQASLAWTTAEGDNLVMLQTLQGNILKGHGRNEVAIYFLKFDQTEVAATKRALRELANFHLTSAFRQLRDAATFKETGKSGGPVVFFFLSSQGYKTLNLEAAAPEDPIFSAGMQASQSALKDPPVGQWEAPFQQKIDAALLVGADIESKLLTKGREIAAVLKEAGITILHSQRGTALRNRKGEGIEHFGYVDGRSQPLMLKEDIDAEVTGSGTGAWNPAFPLSAVLVKDRGTTDNTSFGSYFVFRKLEQDVAQFKMHEQLLADQLGLTGETRELAGALVVGRFEDGTPVTLADEGRGLKPTNNFDYSGDQGSRCPFHAHIRKANPRGTGGAEPANEERAHLMARRGIPYQDVKRKVPPDKVPESKDLAEFKEKVLPLLPNKDVGLLFMAYNSDLANQFEFTQKLWVNNPGFPILNPPNPSGIDPVIGQVDGVPPAPQNWNSIWDNAGGAKQPFDFRGFVVSRGGEYFFAPSITFLRTL
jgi:Dyp-type peroxidase family